MNPHGIFVAQNSGLLYPIVMFLALLVVGAIPLTSGLAAMAFYLAIVVILKVFGPK